MQSHTATSPSEKKSPPVLSHYCSTAGLRAQTFTVLAQEKLAGEIEARKFQTPYESLYHCESVQVENSIYFCGGGAPETDTVPETFYAIFIRFTLPPPEYKSPIIDKLQSMLCPRANHSAAAIGTDRLVVVGGKNANGILARCEEYCVTDKKWTELPKLNKGRAWATLCPLKSRYVYAFGGKGNDTASGAQNYPIEFLDLADKSGDFWHVLDLISGKDLLPSLIMFCGAIAAPEDPTVIMLFGGSTAGGKPNSATFLLSTSTRAMRKGAELVRPDTFCRSKPVAGGDRVLAVGSRNEDLHVYHAGKGSWSCMRKAMWNPDEFDSMIKSDTY